MKKFTIVLFVLYFACGINVKADEGMWLLPLINKLNIDTMHSLGLKLSAEEIYSINHNSLKDAVVMFGGGCTGEIVSDKGLLFTNHHCGNDVIQNHSTVEHNYLEEGFWAMNFSEELPNPDLSVTFLISMEDVTSKVLQSVSDTLSEERRNERIAYVSDSIGNAAASGTHFESVVTPFFGGNDYYLVVYEVYEDVRLVGAPPSSIGDFGSETDNWVWPRHTGDFSIFRVYSGPDGKPAPYSRNNIPLKPKHSLTLSLKERNLNDFAMVLGFSGRTNRYMSSFEIKEIMEISNPNRIKIRGLRQEILMKDMQADEKVNIQYASKYAISSNYWKYSIGQNQGLKRLSVISEKEQQEKDFLNWSNADSLRKQKYGDALNLIKNAVENKKIHTHNLQYTYECFFISSELISFANRAMGLYVVLSRETENSKLIDSLARVLKTRWENFNKEYNAATDMKVTAAMLELYKNNIAAEHLPGLYTMIRNKYKGDPYLYVKNMFEKSIFVNKEKFESFINHPVRKILENDPAFQAVISVMEVYSRSYYGEAAFDSDIEKGQRLYIAGLREMHPGKIIYPDANSTMRLSYGTVQDYYPRDAVNYLHFTTLKGVMEKEDPDNWEFVVSPKLKDLYSKKDFGDYGINDEMPVCFLTNNDITGGNSGSPVIDGEGNLIGLAFDGNWEAMSSDITFEPALQRCICVDIRYVLFIIDKFANASHLIKEMKIIRN